jgi:hypothetical protein
MTPHLLTKLVKVGKILVRNATADLESFSPSGWRTSSRSPRARRS